MKIKFHKDTRLKVETEHDEATGYCLRSEIKHIKAGQVIDVEIDYDTVNTDICDIDYWSGIAVDIDRKSFDIVEN